MASWIDNERVRPLVAAFTTIVVVVACLIEEMNQTRRGRSKEPSIFRDLTRKNHIERVLRSGRDYCVSYLRMDVGPFMHLASIMRDKHLLLDTRYVSVEEQLSMFLHIVGHNTKNRTMRVEYVRSGETISRYFNNVLKAICAIRDDFVHPPCGNCHSEIECNPNWYPFFKDCIGLLDGTHIDASISPQELPWFRGRKGPTQNVLAVVNPDLQFTYVLAGWEGSANDFTVLKDALSRPQPEGKYYLVDAGYTTMQGFIAPYRGVRYHLKEHSGRAPTNLKELFNLQHSMLRSRVERAFAILKNHFKILTSHPFFPFRTQVRLVIACCILHNYIAGVDPNDILLDEGITQHDDQIMSSQPRSQREQREENRQWIELRDKIAHDMWDRYSGFV
ncbi:protein ANTAGONIST OF LIKE HETEROCHROMATIN PROTEIN 1-like [Dioscorea cayenensis subsp. rotundata]|uniref:Protein ANTAGONIST OF LIKE HETEROCHROMATIN PROTEIN 1-like n=1 Tax=Dioscorea cayennensis subsp. rotundata TaxID=55577 RepID=A0AB40CMP9_DIOCR|nr:protein ANTAGONIST OF LIKE HETEROCHROMATIN PROTEIN 1-like [Dioscorea cayenensis subsp. rotundata]